MNLLILGNPSSTLIQQLCVELKKNDNVTIDIISLPYIYKNDSQPWCFDKILNLGDKYNFLKGIPYLKNIYFISNVRHLLKVLPDYDVISIQYAYYYYSFLLNDIKRKTRKFVVTSWGSDFNSLNFWQKYILSFTIKKADTVTSANILMGEKIIERFKISKDKFRIARFGLRLLDLIKSQFENGTRQEAKQIFNFSNKFVITIGYNSNKIQQHFKIINELKKIKDRLPVNTLLLFPMTYNFKNSKNYIKSVQNELSSNGFNFKIIDSYLTDEEVAYLRRSTDIMIQLQKNDLFSGSMQEHLFAGNVVVTGKWLPYKTFKEAGIYFHEISDFSELSGSLLTIIESFDSENKKCISNQDKIWTISSWEKAISNWENILGIK